MCRWSAAVLLLAGCASTAKPGALYSQGIKAFENDDLPGAVKALQAFADKSCAGGDKAADKRCRRAYLTLAKAHDRAKAPGAAWVAYEGALEFPPHDDDPAVEAERDRARSELAERQQKASEQAPVVISYRDEVGEAYNPRSVRITLDGEAILNKEKDASELRSDTFRRVFGRSVAAGEHVLLVEAVHDCKPGSPGCARSRIKKAFQFKCAPRTPTTIEIKAFARDGEGDGPARPAIDLATR
jgi:hypothetical protein